MIKIASIRVCAGSFTVCAILALCLPAIVVSTTAQAAVWRVDAASTATVPDGQTWAAAYPSIQQAADAAAADDEVWVAKGKYTSTELQVANLKATISLYGGFVGTEGTRDQRNWTSNLTIIDGESARQCVSAYFAPHSVVDGFTINNGKSAYGGGMYHGTATNCAFVENAATEEGGGLYLGTAINCSFARNSALGRGGGIHAGTAVNCTFIENSAGRGGGMYDGMATNCTFTRNSATYEGAGIYSGKAVNSIVWGNNPDEVYRTEVTNCCLPMVAAGSGNIVGNPGFVNPQAGDLRLRFDSPCVDAAAAYFAPATDLLGRARPQGGASDLGAYEYYSGDDAGTVRPGIFRVNAASNAPAPDGLTWETAYPTLQAAVDASGGYGAEIWVKMGTYTGETGPEVAKLLPGTSIYGGFAGSETTRDQRDSKKNVTVIDGQQLRRGITASDSSTVDGFTIQNGMAAQGGGMFYGATSNCTFKGNTAAGTNWSYGGGAFNCLATNCTFTGNSAGGGSSGNGAGMFRGTAINCIFDGNFTTGNDGAGGGIYEGTAANCTFSGNTVNSSTGSGVGGGAVRTIATNCVFSKNMAPNGSGGGMYSGEATNCTFSGNSAVSGGGMCLGTAVNCVVWGNAPNEVAGPGLNVSYSCLSSAAVGTGNITSDPKLMDAAAGDLRLQSGSPCIDTGTGAGAPSTDILGVPRPQGLGYDMGAYEVEVLVTVPDLSGLARVAAQELIVGAQLYLRDETEEYHPTIPVDHVVRQNPLAGTQVAQRTQVDLVISKGPLPVQPVSVPDVVGQTQDAATAALTAAGFTVGAVTQQYSLTVPVGTVLSQTPAGGGNAVPGASVDLVVSRGVQPVPVPDVAGQPRAQAESAITGAGLVLGTVTEAHSAAVAAGSVISQSPEAGTEVPPGTVVSIVVSLGAAPVVEGEGEPVTSDTARQQLASSYAASDTNGDGALSFAEASAAVTGLTQAVFDALDTDGDGQLSADELGVDQGAGCTAGCSGGKSLFDPANQGKPIGDLFRMALGALGLTVMAPLRRP